MRAMNKRRLTAIIGSTCTSRSCEVAIVTALKPQRSVVKPLRVARYCVSIRPVADLSSSAPDTTVSGCDV